MESYIQAMKQFVKSILIIALEFVELEDMT